MKKSLVVIHEGEGRASTVLIAEGFKRRHDQVKRLIVRYRKKFEEISPLKGDIRRAKTKKFEEFLLDEDQFLFLGTLFKNNPQVIDFKLLIIKDYRRCRKQLARALNQKHDPQYNQTRLTNKTLRFYETDAIQKFIAYSKKQGGTPKGCDMYYSNFTKMTNTLLFICEGTFKNLRNVLTPEQLMTIGAAEQIIGKTIKNNMENGIFYKDIYKNVKKKVELFAELHGKSEVLNQQLLIPETYGNTSPL